MMNPAAAGSMVNSLSQAALSQAALPGVQADVAIKQRAAAFNQWLTDNSKDFVTPAKDSNGNPTPNVTPTVDVQGLAAKAAQAGYTNEALSMNAADLKNKASQIKNASDFQDLALKTRAAVSTYMEAYGNPVDKDGNPVTPPGDAATQTEYNKVIGGIGSLFGMGGQKLFGTPTSDPTTGAPVYKFDPVANRAMAVATMSPQVQVELQQRQEQLNQSGVQGQSGPEWRDPDSDITHNAQKAAIAADPKNASVYSKMTAAQLAGDKSVGGMVTASIVPAPTRGSLVNGGIEFYNRAGQYNAAADALDAAKADLPDEAKTPNNRVMQWFSTNADKIKNNPKLLAAQSQLAALDQADPSAQLGSKDYGSLGFALRQKALTFRQLGDRSINTSTASNFPEAGTAAKTAPGQPSETPQAPAATPAAPATGSVRVRGPNGENGTMDAKEFAIYKNKGWKIAE
jgi:hypothetical protein